MGLYTSNRFKSISAEPDTLKENTVPLTESEIVEESENNNYFDNICEINGFNNLYETCIQILEKEYALFESMVKDSFYSCMNESVILTESESVNKDIDEGKRNKLITSLEKIQSATCSAIDQHSLKVKEAFDKIVLSDKDKKPLLAQTLAILEDNEDFLDGYEGLKDFSLPSEEDFELIKGLIDSTYLRKNVDKSVSASISIGSKDDIKSVLDEFKQDMNIEVPELKTVSKWIPNNVEVLAMIAFLKLKDVSGKLSKISESYKKNYCSTMNLINKNIDKLKDSEDVFDTYKIEALYKVSTEASRNILKRYKSYTTAIVKYLAMYKKASYSVSLYTGTKIANMSQSENEQEILNFMATESVVDFLDESYSEKADAFAEEVIKLYNETMEEIASDELKSFEETSTIVVYEGANLDELKTKYKKIIENMRKWSKKLYDGAESDLDKDVYLPKRISGDLSKRFDSINEKKKFGKINQFHKEATTNFANNAIKMCSQARKAYLGIKDTNSENIKEVKRVYEDCICHLVSGVESKTSRQMSIGLKNKHYGPKQVIDGVWVKKNSKFIMSELNTDILKRVHRYRAEEEKAFDAVIKEIDSIKDEDTKVSSQWMSSLINTLNMMHKCYSVMLDVEKKKFYQYLSVTTKVIKSTNTLFESTEYEGGD